MDLDQFTPFFLFLHVLGAILAFGPTFAYSIMGSMAGKEPQHANFSSRQVAAIGNKLVYPLAIFQGITGVLLLIARESTRRAAVAGGRHRPVPHRDHLRADGPAQRPAHLIEMTSTPPPPARHPARRRRSSLRRSRRSSAAGSFLGAPDRRHRLPDGGQARPLIGSAAAHDAAVPWTGPA